VRWSQGWREDWFADPLARGRGFLRRCRNRIVRGVGGLFDVASGMWARVDRTRGLEASPHLQKPVSPFALHVWGMRAAHVGALGPIEAEPAEVFERRGRIVGPVAGAVKAILFGTGDAGRVDPRLAWLWAAHVGAGWQPAQVSRGGSGLPTPSRWTFVSALQASTHCMSAALRRAPIRRRRIGRGCACSHSPLEGMGSPSLSSRLNCAAANPACR
jgi:hypothetical protein